MHEKAILSVRHLCKRFPLLGAGLFRRQVGTVQACDDVSFDVMRGETLALVGESGSGKTTLGRLIMCAMKPDSGQILFRSKSAAEPIDLVSARPAALKPLRQELQMVFQDPFGSLNPRMTVGQILEEPLRINGLARGTELRYRVVDMLNRVGLHADSVHRYPNAFSGGQRQRIGIARALILRPALVVCDEAVSALDVSIQAQIVNLLASMQEELGLTYIFIAHDLRLVRQVADRIAVLEDGRITQPIPAENFIAALKNGIAASSDASQRARVPSVPVRI
ncbi:ATP-binding cassette domain-containing protein [Roseateles sp. DC23W]|uniref:ATP-binding cassette domain-containing protein n=1 Tax=Pelomonas dachongensis TaxID=3299029 RepID=A0ABW7EW21_9BURK